jgi:hypothetical protein
LKKQWNTIDHIAKKLLKQKSKNGYMIIKVGLYSKNCGDKKEEQYIKDEYYQDKIFRLSSYSNLEFKFQCNILILIFL